MFKNLLELGLKHETLIIVINKIDKLTIKRVLSYSVHDILD